MAGRAGGAPLIEKWLRYEVQRAVFQNLKAFEFVFSPVSLLPGRSYLFAQIAAVKYIYKPLFQKCVSVSQKTAKDLLSDLPVIHPLIWL